jgi:hypothetical protein
LEENYRPDVLFVRTTDRVRVYPADGFFPSADAVKTASARTWASARMHPKLPKLPELPELPELTELRGLRRQSREKKKVFSA